jgi:protocatechuate 3,4-dioxygenase beta subunit
VRITASKQGFAPMTMSWDADKVPAKFDLLLPEAQTIGGRVTDEAGKPVADAGITLNLPQRLAGPRVAVEEFAVKSDADGRWRCDLAPKDAAYIFVEVSHPEFDSPSGEAGLEALRAGTAELKLFAVATVRGRVLDETERAVPDAELMLGRERDIWPSSSTLEARTDAEGHFEFRRVQLGKRLLGVHATRFAPALQSIEIKRESARVEIRLKPGAPLRVRVVDHAGQPIAGVAARVNEWPSGVHSGRDRLPGRWAYPGWEWETDAEGRFTWSNAPPEMVLWTFTKGGYMSRGHHGLQATPEEQVVKLGLPFRISGSVTDAASGQPVNEFVLTPRFAQTDSFNVGTRTTSAGGRNTTENSSSTENSASTTNTPC